MTNVRVSLIALAIIVISLVTINGTFAQETVSSVAAVQVEKIDINTATAEDLDKLARVGEKLARDIVADREKNGPFLTVDDLARVKRIGKKIVDQNRHMLYVDPALANKKAE